MALPLPASRAVPTGCPIAVFAPTASLPGTPSAAVGPFVVRALTPSGHSMEVPYAVTSRDAAMRVRLDGCNPERCVDEIFDQEVAAIRHEIVFTPALPAGTPVEIYTPGNRFSYLITVVQAGACPPEVAPTATCVMPACRYDRSNCGGTCDAAPCRTSYYDARVGDDDGGAYRDPPSSGGGCRAGASPGPLLVALIGLGMVRRSRRRALAA